jgi:ribA/ribD-fused uncharacterized protein
MPIYFYSSTDEFACFSNFSRHPIVLDGKHWPTTEHYFQAQKFAGTAHEERIRRATSPREAKRLGRDRSKELRADWESVKDDVMRRAVLCKFQTHADIRALLLGTGDEELIENAPNDYYWGCGSDGSGRNMLGRILMEVRTALRRQEHPDE